jgi:hypothetical protein
MGAATGRFYYGDLRLWREAIAPEEQYARTLLQEFQGIDQAKMLVIAASGNAGLDLHARCLGFPNPASKNRRGWVAIKRVLRVAMDARIHRTDPLVWVEDDTTLRVLSGVAGPLMTSAPHPYVTGDVLLIRRVGVGLWSLVTATVVGASTFNAAAVPGTILHAIQPGDEVLRVEAYWLGMVWKDFQREGDQGWYAKEVLYSFRGSGAYSYARTAAAVGS